MNSLKDLLTGVLQDAFAACGLPAALGDVVRSQREDLGQFQCSGALPAAKVARKSPLAIAQDVAAVARRHPALARVDVAPPGFINLTLADDFLASFVTGLGDDPRLGCPPVASPRRVVLDFGGPNVAKAMHVGHLRSAIIGESLQRLHRFMGDDVVSDIHLGDWGTPIGMLITELRRRRPDLPYFAADEAGPFPAEPPVTIEELEGLYVEAAARARSEAAVLAEAQQATVELQQGRPGYRALWRHFLDVSVAALRRDFGSLGISFTLWRGESDYNDRIPGLLGALEASGAAVRSEGALVVPVEEPRDAKPMPPLILMKSDGGYLYPTTDLAAIDERAGDMKADVVLYVVDKRQSLHFEQLFRAARKTGLAGHAELAHVAFGTMNGPDGKPFKTRAGGVMKLKDLIEMVAGAARRRIDEAGVAAAVTDGARDELARQVGLAALKFGDLMHDRASDYVFDLDRFTTFEGRTGPYLQYATVRIKSIFRKAGIEPDARRTVIAPAAAVERALMLALCELPEAMRRAYAQRAPSALCDLAYDLAQTFSSFYHDCHILSEEDPARQQSWLALSRLCLRELELVASLLGLEIPEQM